MTDTTLEQGEAIQKDEWGDSHWVKRAVAVMFCLGLIVTLVVVFTRVIGARIPEQRATLEKLITDRTGLLVRFDNVHFAWDLDGTSAVFTRVELTDPRAGRVRVVAPELRVEFDTWDFLRHRQFSLGHVTLSSPDIEITGDADESPGSVNPPRGSQRAAPLDERKMLRRYLQWAELMPVGKIEVEGARVHLLSRGPAPGDKRTARHSFTLSQAVVSRGNGTFNAFGTMLLSQDVGQSLFVSAKLEGLGAARGQGKGVSGDLRLIARRVALQELPFEGLSGRGTIDARITLRDGRVDSGTWQASARQFEVRDHERARFDHLTLNGRLSRDADAVLLEFTDLQLTRGDRLERAPALSARLALAPGSVEVIRTTANAERLPFMAAELIAGVLDAGISSELPGTLSGWTPTAGELRAVRFDSGPRGIDARAWNLDAQVAGLELTRAETQSTLSQLAGELRFDAGELALRFDAQSAASFRTGKDAGPRPLNLGGEIVLASGTALRFREFSAASGSARIRASGDWNPDAARPDPVRLEVTELDRATLQDFWILLAADRAPPEFLADIEQARILDAKLELVPDVSGEANWSRSSGALRFAELTTGGKDLPRLSAGRGSMKFSRGGSRWDFDGGQVEDLAIRKARFEQPRGGAPRLQATLGGSLDSSLLREALESQGLERLKGSVELDAEARGDRELRDPALWRVAARVSDGAVPLGGGLPAIESLAGTIRYTSGQIRGLSMTGNWLGGPIAVESRRGSARNISLAMKGEADAAPLLELLGQADAAKRVGGRFAWTGSAQPGAEDGFWRLSIASDLSGLESRLPRPFDKAVARSLPVEAELEISGEGVREFSVNGPQLLVHGQVTAEATSASFQVQGIAGELRRPINASRAELTIEKLELARAPQVLAAAGALLPADGEVTITISDSRQGGRALGALRGSVSRQDDALSFALDSSPTAVHQVAASGQCAADHCRLDFVADTAQLTALLRGVQLPAEWPVETLHAAGSMDWPADAQADFARSLAGSFKIQTEGNSAEHQLSARATLANGQIEFSEVQGTGPEADLVFRGNGRIGLLTRDYDLTVDYERVSLAAAAVPSTARAPLARAWNAVRGSVARRGWTEAPVTRRVQWHGSWD